MIVELVSFKEEHREAVMGIENAIFPEYQNDSVNWRAGQQFDDPTQACSKYVAVEINRDLLVGYGAIRTTYPHRYRLNLMVDPEWQRRGIGRTLFAKLEEDLVALKAISLQARVRSDKLEALAFVQRQGFSEVHRMEGMGLSVKEADLSRFAILFSELGDQGVVLASLAEEEEEDPDWSLKLYELHKMALQDWPNDDPTRPNTIIPRDAFADSIKDQVAQPQGVFIAKVNGNYVGYCGEIGTAVHPNFRRRGIATALKVSYVNFAKRHGMETLFTSSANPAIIAMNEKIGYRAENTEVRFIKRLADGL